MLFLVLYCLIWYNIDTIKTENGVVTMKKRNRILACAIIFAIFTSAALPVMAQVSFSDVKQSDWFFDNVMSMTQKGLFSGYEDGKFKPDNSMTRAEFLTVVDKILELDTTAGSDQWYEAVYLSAVDAGIITKGEMSFDKNTLNSPIPREEMSMIAVRAMEKLGETVTVAYEGNVKASISDFSQVGTYYRDYVLKAYSSGVITGYEDNSFRPKTELPRCQAAAVLNRIIDSSAREKKDFSQAVEIPNQDLSAPITIYEGQPRTPENNRFAKEGDIVVKADGTQVVLAKGAHGILGEGQGVAPDLGVSVEKGGNTTVVAGEVFSGATDFKDSLGNSVMNYRYEVNNVTGEGHWSAE